MTIGFCTRHIGRATAFGALVLTALTIPAMAQSTVTATLTREATESYWNSQRRAAAIPMPLRGVSGTPAAASRLAATGAPGAVSGNLPSGSSSAAAPAAMAEVAPALGPGSTIWYAYPPPSTLNVPVIGGLVAPVYPNTALGKLFFTQNGLGYVCSAQSVTSAGTWGAGNQQTVVTAGHCCSDGAGNFDTSFQFVPAYVNGNAPFGTWTAGNMTVYTAWHTGGDYTVDYCVVQMFKTGGQNINTAVGSLGYAFNQPLPQSYNTTGYPAAAPFTGNILYHNFTSDAETDTNQAGTLAFTHGVGSSMTGGSSGGAWITKYQDYIAASNNYFNGLNSYKYTSPNRPAEMFGPYIEDLFVGLLQIVATAPALP